MGVNEPEPARDPDPGPDAEHAVMDAFQAVLDAFDAARAELYEGDELRRLAGSPPPTGHPHLEPARFTGAVGPPPPQPEPPPWPSFPPPPLLPPPAPPRRSRLRPTGLGSEHQDLFRPEQPPWPPPPAPLRAGGYRASVPRPESVPPDTVPPGTARSPDAEAPPPTRSHARARSRGRRRLTAKRDTGAAGVFGVGALSGFIIAFSLLVNDNSAPPAPDTFSGQPDQSRPDDPAQPPGPQPGGGVLRQGDSGDAVFELQKRLLQIPNIYENPDTDGQYDVDVTAAVARFQEWYGVRGDENGVYGDSTRRDLEARTQ